VIELVGVHRVNDAQFVGDLVQIRDGIGQPDAALAVLREFPGSAQQLRNARGESESLAGLVLEIAGEIPKANEVINSGDFDFTILEIKLLSSEYGFVLGKWHLARTIGDIGGHFTLLFRKINGQWLIVADHTS